MDAQTARFLWSGQDPIGRQLKFGSDTRRDDGWLTVVGVSEYVNLWGCSTSPIRKSAPRRASAPSGAEQRGHRPRFQRPQCRHDSEARQAGRCM